MRLCRAQALGGLATPRRQKYAGDPATTASCGPVRQRSASAGGRARRAVAVLAVSGLLGLSGVVACSASPASASSFAVYLNASYQNSIASTVPIGQAVTLTATTDQDVRYTPYYIDVYDTTTGTLMNECSFGVSCPISVAQSVASTHIYVGYVAAWDPNTGVPNSAPPPQIQGTSAEADYITWTNSGYQISLSGPDSVPAGKGGTYFATTNASVPPGDSIQIYNETTGRALKNCSSSPCVVSYQPKDINGDFLVALFFSDGFVLAPPFRPYQLLASSSVFFTFSQ